MWQEVRAIQPIGIMRTLPILILSLCVGAAGCVDTTTGSEDIDVGSTSAPLINANLVEAGEDPAVVALVSSNGSPFCTGTLVSPSVIATAAHCIERAGPDPAISAFFGNDAYGIGRKVDVTAAVEHPDYNSPNGEVVPDDIALFRLKFAQDPSLPVAMQTTRPMVGDPVRRVGFGRYDQQNNFDGQKRTGPTTVTGFFGNALVTGGAGVSTCGGDSGGPAFITGADGVEYLAGVHSYGARLNDVCQPNNDGSTIVSEYLEDFIIPWIQENDPVCGQDSICGYIGCIDDPDCTPCGPDGTCVDDCPLPDPDCRTMGVGEICQLGTQCLSDLCVFYEGDQNFHYCTEECDPAADECPTGMECKNFAGQNLCGFIDTPPGVLGAECTEHVECGSYNCEQGACVYSCDLSQGRGCPADFECSSLDDGANFYCHATESGGGGGGGCSSGSGGGNGGTNTGHLLLIFGVVLVLRLRYNRARCAAN